MEVQVKGELEIEQKGQSCKGNIQDNTAMQDELLKQLHEQYAVNNNANLGTIVTLVVAVIAVIGYFGYVYVHTGVDFSDDFGCLVKPNGEFYLDALLLIYLASVLVIAILVRLCIYQGVAQRKEQFITDAIRREYFNRDFLRDTGFDKVFPEGYHPYGKKGLEIVQGLYGELVKVFMSVFVLLTILVMMKCLAVNHIFSSWKESFGQLNAISCIVMLLTLLLIITTICHYKRQVKYYKKRQEEYPERKEEIEEKKQTKSERKKGLKCRICTFVRKHWCEHLECKKESN